MPMPIPRPPPPLPAPANPPPSSSTRQRPPPLPALPLLPPRPASSPLALRPPGPPVPSPLPPVPPPSPPKPPPPKPPKPPPPGGGRGPPATCDGKNQTNGSASTDDVSQSADPPSHIHAHARTIAAAAATPTRRLLPPAVRPRRLALVERAPADGAARGALPLERLEDARGAVRVAAGEDRDGLLVGAYCWCWCWERLWETGRRSRDERERPHTQPEWCRGAQQNHAHARTNLFRAAADGPVIVLLQRGPVLEILWVFWCGVCRKASCCCA